jgi:hypothetical protein
MEAAVSFSCYAILRTRRLVQGCQMIHGEPKLEELLSEPIVLLTAKRDGVSVEQLRALCERIRAQLIRTSSAGERDAPSVPRSKAAAAL